MCCMATVSKSMATSRIYTGHMGKAVVLFMNGMNEEL